MGQRNMQSALGALAYGGSCLLPLLRTGSQPPLLPPTHAPGTPQQRCCCFCRLSLSTIHPSRDLNVRIGGVAAPTTRSHFSARANLLHTLNPGTKHISMPRFKDPWGSPVYQGLEPQEEMSGSADQTLPQAEAQSLSHTWRGVQPPSPLGQMQSSAHTPRDQGSGPQRQAQVYIWLTGTLVPRGAPSRRHV